MSKNSILALIIIVAVIGFALMFFSKEETAVLDNTDSRTEVEQESTGTFRGSMRDLATRTDPTRCTFTHATEMGSSAGVVYVAEGNIYGDFDIVTAQGSSLKAYMITDGEYSYVWSSSIPQGFKVALADAEAQTSSQAVEGIDYNQALDYDCAPWTADLSVFVPPANVTFIAPGELPQMPMQNMPFMAQ